MAHDDGIELVVHFDGDERLIKTCFGSTFLFIPQKSGGLGERLTAALADTCAPTVVIGTDCLALTADQVRGAILALRCADVVLGPATDGGYYLIGLKSPQPWLSANIPWGTNHVCEITHRRADEAGLKVEMLLTLSDIDRPEDLSFVPAGIWVPERIHT